MCGPSFQEKAIANDSQNFSTALQQNYGTLFSNQQNVLNTLNRSLSPITSAGPNQQGYSAQELAALNTQAINSAGAANKQAMQAARTFGAGQGGGGTSGLTSGITKQIQSAIASQGANALAGRLGQITQANYETGRQNYWNSVGGLQQLAGQYNPSGTAGAAISAGNEAFGQAHEINQENQQTAQMIAGGLTSLAGGALSFATGGLANLGPGESFGEGVGDFFKGGMNALGGRG